MSLLDDVKILTTPNASKAGTLYSIKPDSGTADLDITRASTATRVNSSGIIETVAANVPQLDYTDETCPCFIIEQQRANYHLYSEELDNAAYSKSDVSVSADAITSPDGTTNADECTTTSNFAQMYQTISVLANKNYTWSFYVKRGTMTDVGQQIFNMNGDGDYGAAGKYFSQTSATGWARVSFTFTTGSNGGATRFYPINASGVTGTIYLWGFQLELNGSSGGDTGLQATSYIPTTSAFVTRNVTEWSKTGLSSIINPLEGVLMAEIKFPWEPPNQSIFGLSQSTSNMVQMGYWSGFFVNVTMNGSHLLFSLGFATFDTDWHKIAIKYKSGDIAVWMDGVELVTSSATGTPSASPMDKFSGTYGGINLWRFEGKIKQLQVYDTILTDAQLLALTT